MRSAWAFGATSLPDEDSAVTNTSYRHSTSSISLFQKEFCMLISRGRYLHFDNLDMSLPLISSNCSLCGREFNEAPVSGEHIDLVLMRIRARFEAHQCISKEASATGMRSSRQIG